jgi:alkylation response protein AidB-like acyl-CoA dehydrogenase
MALIDFNSEQKIIQNEIRKFTKAEVEPVADDIDKKAEFPEAIIAKLSELGFMGAIIPDVYDGAGLDTMSLCIIIEELARASASVAMSLVIQNCFIAYPLIACGAEEVKKRFLPSLAAGTIGGFCIHGSFDGMNTFQVHLNETMAQVSGKDDFVMNGAQAGILMIPFDVDGKKCLGVCVKPDEASIEDHDMLGLRSAGIVSMSSKGFEFSKDDMICAEASTDGIFASIIQYRNIGLAAISLGIAEACFQAAFTYAQERQQFKRAICKFPMIREMLVDMRTKVDAARLLVYEAAKGCDNGSPMAIAAYNARLLCDETAVFSGTTSVQIHGGYGYTKDYPAERFFRDAKSVQVIGIPAYEIKELIAKELLS